MRRVFLISTLVVIIDQTTKIFISKTLKSFEIIYVTPFLNIVNIKNKGAAFGLFAGLGNNVFIIISLLAIGILIGYLIRFKRDIFVLSLILGGAVGNLIDRVFLGEVVDFIDFHINRWHWPAFNVADSALSVGLVILLLKPLLTNPTKVS